MPHLQSTIAAAILIACSLVAGRADADQVNVAVAANFTDAAKKGDRRSFQGEDRATRRC